MKYISQIIIKENSENIEKIFVSEEKTFANNRAKYSLKKEGKDLVISLQANDAVALRAVLNSVSKMLIAYEQTKEAIEEINDE